MIRKIPRVAKEQEEAEEEEEKDKWDGRNWEGVR